MNFLSNKKTLYALAFLNVVFIVVIGFLKGDLEILDSKFFYLKSEIQPLLTSLGDDGRSTYMKINIVDFGFMFAYTLFFVGAYFAFFKDMAKVLIFIPLLLWMSDVAETSAIFYLLQKFPITNDGVEYFLMFITPLKWVLALSSLLVIVNGYFVNLYIKKI